MLSCDQVCSKLQSQLNILLQSTSLMEDSQVLQNGFQSMVDQQIFNKEVFNENTMDNLIDTYMSLKIYISQIPNMVTKSSGIYKNLKTWKMRISNILIPKGKSITPTIKLFRIFTDKEFGQ